MKKKVQNKTTAYKNSWDKENTKQYKLKLSLNTDSDIIEYLDNLENRQGKLKELIRADIEKEKK